MPVPSSSLLRPANAAVKRPRGLWRARATLAAPRGIPVREPDSSDTDHDHDDSDASSSSSSDSGKRQIRLQYDSSGTSSSDNEEDEVYHWDFAQRQICGLDHCHLPQREQGWTRRQRIMATTSTAFVGAQTETKTSCDLEDWMDLKDLFAKAAEQYETNTPSETLPLLRGVVHECHSFLKFYQDPSILFSGPRSPPEEPLKRDWSYERHAQKRKCKCIELPTAFHAILGTALFLFGNLIDQDGSLALPGEPDKPIPYWLAALDVFETGENLPSRVYATGCDAPEDWRMAIVWGRTLIAIADATITQAHGKPDCTAIFAEEPHWPTESPFAAIALRRPPLTRRMTLATATPNDIMTLAMDQFSRGIFHMPHPQRSFPPARTCLSVQPTACQVDDNGVQASSSPLSPHSKHPFEPFSRPKELYTIASEVMLLAEKLPNASERRYWASWADSVLNQMKMEADMDAWRSIISRARGKCWLISGSVHADELEDKIVEGDEDVLDTATAVQARCCLEKAIEFLEKGKSDDDGEEDEERERRKMLAEALFTLGNFTKDCAAQENLFSRAEQAVGDGDDGMDVDY